MLHDIFKTELQKRIVFGALAATAAALAVYIGGYVFYFFVGGASLVASLEFDKMRRDGKVSFLFCVVPILVCFMPVISILVMILAMLCVIMLQYIAKRYYAWLFMTIPYIALPAISLIWLRGQEYGMKAVFWLAVVIVVTDTAAYFTGKAWGKTPLAPKISPKKTWEGFAGGALAASIASWIFTGMPIFALLGLLISVVAQVSDLMESAIKRNFEVKDSGNFLPGHGGIMDRADSFVLTAPLLALATAYGVMPW